MSRAVQAAREVRQIQNELQAQLEHSSCEPTPEVRACAQRLYSVVALAKRGGYIEALAEALRTLPDPTRM